MEFDNFSTSKNSLKSQNVSRLSQNRRRNSKKGLKTITTDFTDRKNRSLNTTAQVRISRNLSPKSQINRSNWVKTEPNHVEKVKNQSKSKNPKIRSAKQNRKKLEEKAKINSIKRFEDRINQMFAESDDLRRKQGFSRKPISGENLAILGNPAARKKTQGLLSFYEDHKKMLPFELKETFKNLSEEGYLAKMINQTLVSRMDRTQIAPVEYKKQFEEYRVFIDEIMRHPNYPALSTKLAHDKMKMSALGELQKEKIFEVTIKTGKFFDFLGF